MADAAKIKSKLQSGDLFLTRNAGGEEANPTPGNWNHCAVYAGGVQVVEAQSGPAKVIISDLDEFLGRYPEIQVLRLVGQKPGSGVAVASASSRLVGRPYKALVSRFNRLKRGERRGENCVTVARRAVMDAIGEDPKWKIPDDVAADPRLSAVC
ncbi:MAG: hypothetical protein WCY09_08600 [Candidatus Omnitrophota bacterium]|jgi:hypothetical protein